MKPALPFLILVLSSVAFLHAAPLPSAVTEADLDVPSCQILRGAVAEPLDADTLRGLLGFDEVVGKETKRPRPGRAPQGEALPQYLLVFKKPIAIGTVLGASGELRWHKSAAPWPANVANPSDWVSLEVPASQSSPSFAPLPPGTQTRALLASLPARKDGPYLRLLEPRVTNHTPAGTANAEAAWTTEPQLSAPYTFDAGHITRGYGEWINAGKDGKGINAHAPITDVAPTWIVLSWPEKRAVDGVVLQDNFDKFELQTYEGPGGLNPAAATEQEWKTIRKFQQTLVSGQRWLLFPQVETRALRLRVTKVSGTEPSVAHLAGFHAFAMLGDQPAPVLARHVEQEPPLKIPYELAQAGQVTLVIDGPEGTRVRNVIANVDQSAGANAVSWDLRNEAGAYVPPGKYKWRALTHPPLEFRYEMTAYPNVTSYFPERPAWLTGPDGPGGWLADHTPPRAACSAGDRVFLGAAVSESGVSLIECDLEGRKLWGHASFAGFTGVGMLASDGQTLFNMMSAANFAAAAGMDKSTEGLWAIDLKTRAVRTLATLQPTAERKRGVQGIAARDNKVYLAVRSPADWLVNAAAAVDVDPLHCLPAYGTPRPARAAHEVVPDPRNDFLKLFRLKDQPPGQQNPQNLVYLESTKGSEAQQHILLAFSKPVALGSLVFPPPAKEEKMQFQISVLKPNAPYPPRPQEKADWEVVPLADPSAWAVVPLPAGTMTRAVRFTFLERRRRVRRRFALRSGRQEVRTVAGQDRPWRQEGRPRERRHERVAAPARGREAPQSPLRECREQSGHPGQQRQGRARRFVGCRPHPAGQRRRARGLCAGVETAGDHSRPRAQGDRRRGNRDRCLQRRGRTEGRPRRQRRLGERLHLHSAAAQLLPARRDPQLKGALSRWLRRLRPRGQHACGAPARREAVGYQSALPERRARRPGRAGARLEALPRVRRRRAEVPRRRAGGRPAGDGAPGSDRRHERQDRARAAAAQSGQGDHRSAGARERARLQREGRAVCDLRRQTGARRRGLGPGRGARERPAKADDARHRQRGQPARLRRREGAQHHPRLRPRRQVSARDRHARRPPARRVGPDETGIRQRAHGRFQRADLGRGAELLAEAREHLEQGRDRFKRSSWGRPNTAAAAVSIPATSAGFSTARSSSSSIGRPARRT